MPCWLPTPNTERRAVSRVAISRSRNVFVPVCLAPARFKALHVRATKRNIPLEPNGSRQTTKCVHHLNPSPRVAELVPRDRHVAMCTPNTLRAELDVVVAMYIHPFKLAPHAPGGVLRKLEESFNPRELFGDERWDTVRNARESDVVVQRPRTSVLSRVSTERRFQDSNVQLVHGRAACVRPHRLSEGFCDGASGAPSG